MCNFAKDMDFGGLSGTNDYTTYGNAVSRREFVIVISQHIEIKQVEEVRSSLCFSLLLDESTDRTLESHFIVYLSYIDKDGLGQPKSLFLSLSPICNDIAQSIYDAWISTCVLYKLQSSTPSYRWSSRYVRCAQWFCSKAQKRCSGIIYCALCCPS
jgi:hypothetical protein